MKKHKNSQEKPQHLKRKLMSALCMLLISTIVLGVTSYAWLVMSIAPEVTGMTANVGANGSLEIALLNKETREDLSKISSLGGSLASRNPSANNTWGNVIDLSYTEYGLQEMVLWPARLNMIQSGDKYIVDSGLLAVPTYGYDGRIIELTDDTVSGTYDGNAFSTVIGMQDYGVRVVGTADSMSVQGSSLALAKSNIKTYTQSASNAAKAALDSNADALMTMLMFRDQGYDDADLAVMKDIINGLQNSLDYIDRALRQGMIAFAASKIVDEATFNSIKDMIQNTDNSLSEIVDTLKESYEFSEDYDTWITRLAVSQNNLNHARSGFDTLSGGSYEWEDFKTPLGYIIDIKKVYVGEDLFTSLDTDALYNKVMNDGEIELILAPGSGVFADVSDYTDDYSVMFSYSGMVDVTITTMTLEEPSYLLALAAIVEELTAIGGADGETLVDLTSTYGYVVDMAFRTNAAVSNLLLQTIPTQRVYDDSDNARTMGGGSYMEFTTDDETFTLEHMLELMDAVRVAFIDDQGTLLGIAKLNTSNRVVDGEKVQAPLYLYGFHIDEEDGSLQMDERQKVNNVITALEQNTAKAVSAVVWLDGDIVDNSMVAATEETSLNGTLNLQFASSANLIAGGNNSLMDISSDKVALDEAIKAEKETVDAGQGLYTTTSWEIYMAAYNYAVAVNDNEAATEYQIYTAAYELAVAKAALVEVTHDALADQIAAIREFVGSTDDLVHIVVYDEETKAYMTVDPFTMEQYDNQIGSIYRVNYDNNLQDEGNGIMTPIYSDATWSALAAALYDAEVTNLNAYATNTQIDDAMTALEVAYDALERMVFYLPHEYNGRIYYLAISDETDTYGKWYDSDFKRITSDLTILKLDAQAETVEIAEIEQFEYIPNDIGLVTPYIDFLDEIYPELSGESIKALAWTMPGLIVKAMTPYQATYLTELITIAIDLGVDAELIEDAQKIADKNGVESYSNAQVYIDELAAAIDEKTPSSGGSSGGSGVSYMTADQRIVLTIAANTARAVNGYDDNTITALNDLRTATTAVEEALAEGANTTESHADEVLAALNTELIALGEKEVTAYNTLTYNIPISYDTYEIVYEVDNPNSTLYVPGDRGDTSITAVVLTESGVVFTLTQNATIYSRAGGTKIVEPTEAPVGGEMYNSSEDGEVVRRWNRVIEEGNVVNLSTALFNREIPKLDEDGNAVVDTESGEIVMISLPNDEVIEEYIWSSSDTEIATVVNDSAATCTINAIGAGEVTVLVSVETIQGNTYTASITITVTP